MQTTFLRKKITRQKILDAFHEFSRQYPDTDQYENWLQNPAYKYAIRYDGRLYPPKHILSVVTDIPTAYFNGGDQTNRVFRQLGFELVDK